MDTIFIRHNLTATPKALNKLWRKRLIAVHFGDNYSTNPKDYKSAGRKALIRLCRYCKEGAVVGAYYRQIKPESILVGYIKQDKPVAKKIENHIYKVVQLKNVKEVRSPLLLASQPRQATITGWPSVEKYLPAVLNGGRIPFKVNSLNTAQLEVICCEYLRKKKILEALLMPIGRTLRDVDIWGIDNKGKTVMAQVTFTEKVKEIESKIEKLKCHGTKNDRLFFFGPSAYKTSHRNIEYISIEEVFDDFKVNNGSVYYLMLKKMLTYKIV